MEWLATITWPGAIAVCGISIGAAIAIVGFAWLFLNKYEKHLINPIKNSILV